MEGANKFEIYSEYPIYTASSLWAWTSVMSKRVLSNWAVPLYVILFHSCTAYKTNYKCVHLCMCVLVHTCPCTHTHRYFSAGTHTGKQLMLVVNLSNLHICQDIVIFYNSTAEKNRKVNSTCWHAHDSWSKHMCTS